MVRATRYSPIDNWARRLVDVAHSSPRARALPIGPYWYENLGEDEFQKLGQTLIVNQFGTDVRCWPVGQKDGGRDITRRTGDGGVVYQVKWAKTAPKNPVTWLESTVEDEAPQIEALVRTGATRYVLMTSVSGTAAKADMSGKGAGTIDRFDATLERFRKRFGLDSMECWWRDDIDTRVNLLDTSTLFHYAAMLSGADALRLLAEGQHEAAIANELASLLRRVISAQWSQDSKVKFKQAELDNDSLHALFVDVHATAAPPHGVPTAQNIANAIRDTRSVGGAVAYLAGSSLPFTLVRGEPGQGKSTMGQYLAQVYRAEFISDSTKHAVDRPTLTPASSRVPVRIELRDYAAWLDGDDPFAPEPDGRAKKPKRRARGDVERFLQVLLAELAATDLVPLDTVHEILDRFPIALIFDGLDEVGQPALRTRIVEEITTFVGRYRRGAAMTPKLIVTTRPNVSDLAEPSSDLFELLVLDRLDDPLRTEYLRKWCNARGIEKRDRRELMRTFNTRKVEPHIAQLTGNPMQLTILLYLLHRQGRSVPDRRTPLYDEYMKTSLSREADKTSSVQANRADLEEVVAFLGWHLQTMAEEHNSAGRVPTSRLRSRIFEYLDTNGKDTGLVDALFTDVTDRVWVLTSKLQGTFEFDVQPVREFFAAKYLDHYASEDKARILSELISRPFWLNTSRFFAGFATPNEVSGLVDGLADTLAAAQRPLSDRISVWTLLADGVFAQRARAQQRAVELLTDDLSVRLLTSAAKNDSLPAMPADRGAALYCQTLLDAVAADPAAPLASERMTLAVALAVDSPPLGQWWLDHAQPAFGTTLEHAWLQVAVPLAAGRLLTGDSAATLALKGDATACTAVAAGVAPSRGSETETRLLRAVLDGHCSDVAAPNPGLLADLTNVFAPREFIALHKGTGRAPYNLRTAHCSSTLATERRRDAFRRLNNVNAELGKAQAAMNSARSATTTVAPWSACADHLRKAFGPCWLAADIAIIGAAAIDPYRRRDTGPWDPNRTPFGEQIDYGRLVSDIRQHRNDPSWWREQRDALAPGERDLWVYALLAVAHADIVGDCLQLMADDLDHLPASQLEPLMASSSRLGLSGISRRLPAELAAAATMISLPLALLVAHHADSFNGSSSTFSTQQAANAAVYGTAAWPALAYACAVLINTSALSYTNWGHWLDVVAAHGPHAQIGHVIASLPPELATRILDAPASYPLVWVQAAEQLRSLAHVPPPLADIGAGWFDD